MLLAPGHVEKASVVALAVADVDVLVAVADLVADVVADGETEALSSCQHTSVRNGDLLMAV